MHEAACPQYATAEFRGEIVAEISCFVCDMKDFEQELHTQSGAIIARGGRIEID